MAIAKMKKLTLLAEQDNKDLVLKSIQEMQNVEVIPLPEVLEDELTEGFSTQSTLDQVNENNEYYQDLEYNLSFLNQYVPQPGLIEGLRRKREVFTLKELEKKVEKINLDDHLSKISEKEERLNQISEEKKNLEEEEFYLRKWKNLDFLPSEVSGFNLMDVIVGSIDVEYSEDFEKNLEDFEEAYYSGIFKNEDAAGYFIIVPKRKFDSLNEILEKSGFQKLDYEYNHLPEEELGKNQEKRSQLIEEERELKNELKTWKNKKYDLEFAIEYFYNRNEREKVKSLLLNSEHLFLISGWIEEESFPSIKENLDENLQDDIAIMTDDIQTEEYENVPTVLNNNKFVKPFEMVVEMYSLPKYGDLDPTPWITPFFFLFFGMMSADAGYGILLNLATLIALKFFTLGKGTKQFLTFLHFASYATVIIGLIFGSFFGFDLPFRLVSLQDDVMAVMIFSVFIGLVQLILGLLLSAYSKHKEGDHAGSYIDGYSWALMLVGFTLWGADQIYNISSTAATVGIWLIILNLIGIILVSTFSNDNKLAGLGLGFFGLTDLASYVGDIVSYTRLMALAVASANIAIAFNLILGFLPPIIRFTIGIALFLVLHAVNIFIAYLGAYVHSARLMYVEFFGKFYEGGGRTFKPLQTLEKYIWLNYEK